MGWFDAVKNVVKSVVVDPVVGVVKGAVNVVKTGAAVVGDIATGHFKDAGNRLLEAGKKGVGWLKDSVVGLGKVVVNGVKAQLHTLRELPAIAGDFLTGKAGSAMSRIGHTAVDFGKAQWQNLKDLGNNGLMNVIQFIPGLGAAGVALRTVSKVAGTVSTIDSLGGTVSDAVNADRQQPNNGGDSLRGMQRGDLGDQQFNRVNSRPAANEPAGPGMRGPAAGGFAPPRGMRGME